MKMYTRQEDQGQIVEISYGYGYDGTAYRRTFDRSDRSETWESGELDWDEEPEGDAGPDHVPCVLEWVPCEAPK